MRKDRIEARLRALRITQFDAAQKAGKNAHFIYDFLIGRKKSFKGDGPIRLAQALECSVEYLTGDSDDVGRPPSPGAIFTQPPAGQGLPVAGVVEAGVFRRTGTIRPSGETLPLAPQPSYPPEAQAAFVVRGGGLDSRGITEGMVLVAVQAEAAPEALQSGALVVVEHSRRNGREIEMSARELQYFPDRTEFRALSKSEIVPPIVLRNGKTDEPGGKLKIVAVVLSATLML